MKVNWNRKYTTVAIYALVVIMAAVLFVLFVFKFESFKHTFSWIGSVAAPMICGIIIAYVLNPLMVWLEEKMFGNFKKKQPKPKKKGKVMTKLQHTHIGDSAVVKSLEMHSPTLGKSARRRRIVARVVSLTLTILIFITVLGGIIVAIVPNVSKSVVSLADNMGGYMEQVKTWIESIFENQPQLVSALFKEVENFDDLMSALAEKVAPYAGDIVGNISGFVGNLLVGLKNFLLGFIIAIYLLFSKERLMAQMKKIVCAFMKPTRAESFLHGCSRSNHIFKQYIISNLVDAMIIFIFMLVGMFAMGMPYQMLIAVICGVTNLIPFFGPFIGAIPCGVLILLVDPGKVIWFGIFVLVLQQVDGNIIKPLLFGETMGLPAIWVLVSITIGGALFKVPGMLLGAPVFAVFYMLFAELVTKKLHKRNLPGETDIYEAESDTLAQDYLHNAEQPGATPVSFEEATKPPPVLTPEERELPEPLSEKRRKPTRKRK